MLDVAYTNTMASPHVDKYQPAFATASYDTQGFCLKHPMIRVCTPAKKKLTLSHKSSGTDTTDDSYDVISPCPMCNPNGSTADGTAGNESFHPPPFGSGGGTGGGGGGGGAAGPPEKRGNKNGLFYNRESSRDRSLPPKEKLLQIQQREQRRKRREGDKSSWGIMRQRNLLSRREIRESGLTKGRGRSISLDKNKHEGGGESGAYHSDSETRLEARRSVSRIRSRSRSISMSHRSRSRSSATTRTTPAIMGGAAAPTDGVSTAATSKQRSRSMSLSEKIRGESADSRRSEKYVIGKGSERSGKSTAGKGSSYRSEKYTRSTSKSSRRSDKYTTGRDSQRSDEYARSTSKGSWRSGKYARSDGKGSHRSDKYKTGRGSSQRSDKYTTGKGSRRPDKYTSNGSDRDASGKHHENDSSRRRRGRSRGVRSSHHQSSLRSSKNSKTLIESHTSRRSESRTSQYSRATTTNKSHRSDKDDNEDRKHNRAQSSTNNSRRSLRTRTSISRQSNSRRSSSKPSRRDPSRDKSNSSARLSKTPSSSALKHSKLMEGIGRQIEQIASHDTHKKRGSQKSPVSTRRHSRNRASSREHSVISGAARSRDHSRGSRALSRESAHSRATENSKHMEEIELKCKEIAEKELIANVQIVVPSSHPTNLKEQVHADLDVPPPKVKQMGRGTSFSSQNERRRLSLTKRAKEGNETPSRRSSKSLNLDIFKVKQRQQVLALLGADDTSSSDKNDHSSGDGALVPHQGPSLKKDLSSGDGTIVPHQGSSDKKDHSSTTCKKSSLPKHDASNGYHRTKSTTTSNNDQGGSKRNDKHLRHNSMGNILNTTREEGNTKRPKPSYLSVMKGQSSPSPAETQGPGGSERTEKAKIAKVSCHAEKWDQGSQRNHHESSDIGDGSDRITRGKATNYKSRSRSRRRSYVAALKGEEAPPPPSPHAEKHNPIPPTTNDNSNNHLNIRGRSRSNRVTKTSTRGTSPHKNGGEDLQEERKQHEDKNKSLLEEGELQLETRLEASQRRVERLRKLTAERCLERLRKREAAKNPLNENGNLESGTYDSSNELSKESSRSGGTLYPSSSKELDTNKLDGERKLERSEGMGQIRKKSAPSERAKTRKSHDVSARRNSSYAKEKGGISHKPAYESDGDIGRESSGRRSRHREQSGKITADKKGGRRRSKSARHS